MTETSIYKKDDYNGVEGGISMDMEVLEGDLLGLRVQMKRCESSL